MSTARLFTITSVLTVGAVVVWAVKAVVIGLAGGLDQSDFEAPLFAIGFALYVLGVIAIGLSVSAGRGALARILGVAIAVVIAAVVFLAVDWVVAGLAPDNDPHWVWAEVQLWIVSVVTAGTWFALRNRAAPVSPLAT